MASPQSIQAGNQEAWFMFYDTNGDPSGNSPVALGSGTSAPAYKLIGIQTAPSPIPESETVTVPGDDTSLGAINFASDAPREMLLNFGLMDLTFEALLQNSLVENFGTISMGLLDTDIPFTAYGALIIQSKAVKKTPGVSGQSAYSGWVYPYVQLFPLGRETAEGRTAGSIRYKGVAQAAFNNPWGTTITDKNGAQASAYARPFTAAHPLTLHAFRGAVSTLVPLRAPAALASTRAWVDKVAVTITSINTPTTPLITFSAPTAAGRPGAALFEYE